MPGRWWRAPPLYRRAGASPRSDPAACQEHPPYDGRPPADAEHEQGPPQRRAEVPPLGLGFPPLPPAFIPAVCGPPRLDHLVRRGVAGDRRRPPPPPPTPHPGTRATTQAATASTPPATTTPLAGAAG